MTKVIPSLSSQLCVHEAAIAHAIDSVDWKREILNCAQHASRGKCAYTMDACYSAGLEALWRATVSFDNARGFPFDHYARRSIHNAIKREVIRLSDCRCATGGAVGCSDAAIESTGVSVDPPDDILEKNERSRAVNEWVASQPQPTQALYNHLYVEEGTQREYASKLNISQPRVAQLNKQMLERGARALGTLAA